MEVDALRGGKKLLVECKPILQLKNECVSTSKEIQDILLEINYICNWHVHSYFNENNYAGLNQSFFPEGTLAIDLVCAHAENRRTYDLVMEDTKESVVETEAHKHFAEEYTFPSLDVPVQQTEC